MDKKQLALAIFAIVISAGAIAGVGYQVFQVNRAEAAVERQRALDASKKAVLQRLASLQNGLTNYAARKAYSLDEAAPISKQVADADTAFEAYLSLLADGQAINPAMLGNLDKPYQMVQALKGSVVAPLQSIASLNQDYGSTQAALREVDKDLAQYENIRGVCSRPFGKAPTSDLLMVSCTDVVNAEAVVLLIQPDLYRQTSRPAMRTYAVIYDGNYPYTITHSTAFNAFETQEMYQTFRVIDPQEYQGKKAKRDQIAERLSNINDRVASTRAGIRSAILAFAGSSQPQHFAVDPALKLPESLSDFRYGSNEGIDFRNLAYPYRGDRGAIQFYPLKDGSYTNASAGYTPTVESFVDAKPIDINGDGVNEYAVTLSSASETTGSNDYYLAVVEGAKVRLIRLEYGYASGGLGIDGRTLTIQPAYGETEGIRYLWQGGMLRGEVTKAPIGVKVDLPSREVSAKESTSFQRALDSQIQAAGSFQ